jgi:hypothetical protein
MRFGYGGHAGWLGVESRGYRLKAQMLWGWGGVFKLDEAALDGKKLVLKRVHRVDSKKPNSHATKA